MAKNFLETLQESDERTKMRWVIGCSAVAMAVVIFLWFGYFNTLITNFGEPEAAVTVREGEELGFIGTMRSGLAAIGELVRNGAEAFSDSLAAPRRYSIAE